MISSLHVEGYRKLKLFDVRNLKRTNLFVGTNNSGKSSVLEALYLLVSRGSPEALWQILDGRGEMVWDEQINSRLRLGDVTHLFHGHSIGLGSTFSMVSEGSLSSNRRLAVTIDEYKSADPIQFSLDPEDTPPSALALKIIGNPKPDQNAIPLSAKAGLIPTPISYQRRILRSLEQTELVRDVPVKFITTRSLDVRLLSSLWNNIMLRPGEERVLNALRVLEPSIERIALQADTDQNLPGARNRGGFLLRLRDNDVPIPIGSMGEGMWRMLAIAIAISQCSGGVLLIDEIDTGMHYSVMSNLWRMVLASAHELDVQIFATTHSYDCIEGLGSAVSSGQPSEGDVSLQRISGTSCRVTSYDEVELEVATEKGIEVR